MAKELNLPDFDEMLDMASGIGGLVRDISLQKNQLDAEIASITRIIFSDNTHWDNKTKPPAMNYIQATFHKEGYNKETKRRLGELRDSIAGMEGDAEYLKRKFQIYAAMIDVWKASQYNLNQSTY